MDYTLDYLRIGLRIGNYRRDLKMSQAELAELTDLSVGYISHIETGSKKASLEVLVRVASVLNVTVDRLLLGNQVSDKNSYTPEIRELLDDCSNYEKAVIFDTARNLKKSLRNNLDLNKNNKYY